MKKIEQKVFGYLKKTVWFEHEHLKPEDHISTKECVTCGKESTDLGLIRIGKPYERYGHVGVCNKCYKGK